MPVVLDNGPGDRVGLYLYTGSAWVKALADASGRLRIAEPRERSPLKVVRYFAAGSIAPHGWTERWTYTVPAGKKAILEAFLISLVRDAPPTTAGLGVADIRYTPSGGTQIKLAEVYQLLATLNIPVYTPMALQLLMLAGDNLNANTLDTSTGGSYSFILSAALTEFDA